MIKSKLSALALTLILASCSNLESPVNSLDSKNPTIVSLEGASSGGGNYSQRPSHQMLEIAKLNLAEGIRNSYDELFLNFPEDLQKEDIAHIIEQIEFKSGISDRVKRDGSFLKFDYNIKDKKIVALYDFYVVYNIPSLLALSKKQFRETLKKIQIDILHELSHFLKIGTDSQTDFTSEVFAHYMWLNLTGSSYFCTHKKFSLVLNPFSKIMNIHTGATREEKHYQNDSLVNSLLKDSSNVYPNLSEAQAQYHDRLNGFDTDSWQWTGDLAHLMSRTQKELDSQPGVYFFVFSDLQNEDSGTFVFQDQSTSRFEKSLEADKTPLKLEETVSAKLTIDTSLNATLQLDVETASLSPNKTNTQAWIDEALEPRHFEEKLECLFETEALNVEVFKELPVESVRDKNYKELTKKIFPDQ